MTQRRIAIAALLVLVFVGAASAKGGAGSVFFGFSEPSWHPSFLPESSSSYQLSYFGGEGYGVDSDGVISGGFIMALSSTSSDQSDMTSQDPLAFGMAGGAILGSRLVSEPGLHLDLAARVGVGGFIGQSGQYVTDSYGYSYYDSVTTDAYFVGYFEPYIELGVKVFRWMRVSAVLGYQYMPNLSPGKPFEKFWLSNPTLGFTASFGKF